MIKKIGLFDSGVGGLTVLREMVGHFPEHQFAYLGDTARLPYGTKSPETLKRYVEQNIAFLKAQKVDLIISACHSASSSMLKYNLKDEVPLFEVITPSCKEALETSSSKKVGVLGTLSTVKSGIYPQTLRELSPQVSSFQQPAPMLVPLVESGWVKDSITTEILKRYLNPLLAENIDSLILACTHYPLLVTSIAEVCGAGVTLINPAKVLADQLAMTFAEPFESSQLEIDVFLTDHSPHFLEHSRSLMGEKINEVMRLKSPDFL